MKEIPLSKFQDFLRLKNHVHEKYISFYAHWARKFLVYLDRNEPMHQDLCIEKYLDYLKDQQNISNWQVRQADESVRLFIYHFLDGDLAGYHPNVQGSIKRTLDISSIINETRKVIRLRHYSYRTEQSYIDWIKRFSSYVEKTNKKDLLNKGFDTDDVRNYLSYLALKKRVAASTQNQAFNALLFLFRNVLHKDFGDLRKTVRAKRGQRLPVVLSVEEVGKLLQHVKGANLLVLQLLYGSGLRLMEAVRLRVKDIDFGSDLLFVRDGKGGKDRTTVLPDAVKKPLRLHFEKVRSLHEKDLTGGYGEVNLPDALERKYPNAPKQWHWQYVFPSLKLSADPRSGKIMRHHIHSKTIQSSLKNAVKKADIAKHVSVHTLRHSFATHLLMSGVNIREIQQLLGHKNVETTMIYTHVLRDVAKVPQSPLDAL